jgi:hypothetical protein
VNSSLRSPRRHGKGVIPLTVAVQTLP